jgi:3-oxoacyl-[acyl-carrier protein] reductase
MTSTGSWAEYSGLDGTVAVITGGAAGLGEAITADLAANGVLVAVLDDDAEAVARLARRLGDRAVVRCGDACEAGHLVALFEAVEERWGRLDTLVSVARDEDAERAPALVPVLQACSLAVPRLVAAGRGGSIVNVTTAGNHQLASGHSVHSASMAALDEFAQTLALELRPEGIRVNNVAPDCAPLGGARPEEVSAAVVFLASALSCDMTGSTLHPDGDASGPPQPAMSSEAHQLPPVHSATAWLGLQTGSPSSAAPRRPPGGRRARLQQPAQSSNPAP